jgi:hypothetical protein
VTLLLKCAALLAALSSVPSVSLHPSSDPLERSLLQHPG